MTVLLVALGGGVGSALRYLLTTRLDSARTPRGTLLANVVGSCVLGALVGAGVDGHALALLGTGLCAGFTTYSAFAVQTHRLGPTRGAAYAVLTVGLSLAACAAGFAIAQA